MDSSKVRNSNCLVSHMLNSERVRPRDYDVIRK